MLLRSDQNEKKDIIELKIPSKPDYMSVVRLTSSAICCNAGLSIEDIEDIKVSIAEACINALNKSEELSIKFKIEKDKLTNESKKNVSPYKDDAMDLNREIELGILIIKSLMDEVNFNEEGVEMIKYIEDGNKWRQINIIEKKGFKDIDQTDTKLCLYNSKRQKISK